MAPGLRRHAVLSALPTGCVDESWAGELGELSEKAFVRHGMLLQSLLRTFFLNFFASFSYHVMAVLLLGQSQRW